jgi:COP9 signalosome complex subunit 3
MASSTSNQAGPSAAPATTTLEEISTLDELVQFLFTTQKDAAFVNKQLSAFTKKDARDGPLAGTLETGQDPLHVLDPENHTLGYLYILLSIQVIELASNTERFDLLLYGRSDPRD